MINESAQYARFTWEGGQYRASVKANGYALIERTVNQGATWQATHSLNLLEPATQALRDAGIISGLV